ncbi:uncharacterized protein LOC123547020 [Mercenaria mercenaria]|uniref:uncharacterized protein LOC123547020 n=1 Tax=Mercenaria mercenaria TaxID=6596 RepID=UPI001E1D6F80|nr:uncharacterized protein LOC123547020 [Mercenaria mercenaria]XP_045189695.1 uncharacterized protein LOC123547020 [Mercenaria mercenaria]
MVVSVAEIPYLDVSRMNRNTMRPVPNVAVMAAKPPKPPCWRDFVSHSLMAESEFTDISKMARSSNDSFSSDGHTNKTAGKPKRLRARIHRTRSQFAIEESDLPAETLTMTLAETKPDDIGLCRETSFNERIFQEDNNRKCQTWLQSVEASKPLEDVSCYDLSGLEGEAVSIEIPDDTQSYEQTDGCQKNKSNKSVHLKNTHKSSAYEQLPTAGSSKAVIPTLLKHGSSFKEDNLLNTG